MPYNVLEGYQCFGGIFSLHPQGGYFYPGIGVAAGSYEIMVNFCYTPERHVPEASSLREHILFVFSDDLFVKQLRHTFI
jgi:hypothetical protein